MRRNAYTLMELVIAIAIIAAVVVTGVGVFYRSLYGSSRASLNISLDGQARSAINSMERLLVYSRMVDLDGQNRTDCLLSEEASISGMVLRFSDDYGVTSLSLDNDNFVNRIASNSSYISSSTLDVPELQFFWDCRSMFDTVGIVMKARVWSGKAEVFGHESVFKQTILLRNSGGFVN